MKWTRRTAAAATAAIAGLVVAQAASAVLIDYAANDTSTGFSSTGGSLGIGLIDSQSDGNAASVTSSDNPLLANSEVEFKIALSDPADGFHAFSSWIGGNAGGADVLILDSSDQTILLALELHSIATTGLTEGAASSITLGSLDESDPKSDLQIVGGSLAGLFPGEAHLALLIDDITPDFPVTPGLEGFGFGALNSSFTGRTNLQLGFVATPEPGTAMLLGTALLVLAAGRRLRGPS